MNFNTKCELFLKLIKRTYPNIIIERCEPRFNRQEKQLKIDIRFSNGCIASGSVFENESWITFKTRFDEAVNQILENKPPVCEECRSNTSNTYVTCTQCRKILCLNCINQRIDRVIIFDCPFCGYKPKI